jgi:hypothetical protein
MQTQSSTMCEMEDIVSWKFKCLQEGKFTDCTFLVGPDDGDCEVTQHNFNAINLIIFICLLLFVGFCSKSKIYYSYCLKAKNSGEI